MCEHACVCICVCLCKFFLPHIIKDPNNYLVCEAFVFSLFKKKKTYFKLRFLLSMQNRFFYCISICIRSPNAIPFGRSVNIPSPANYPLLKSPPGRLKEKNKKFDLSGWRSKCSKDNVSLNIDSCF